MHFVLRGILCFILLHGRAQFAAAQLIEMKEYLNAHIFSASSSSTEDAVYVNVYVKQSTSDMKLILRPDFCDTRNCSNRTTIVTLASSAAPIVVESPSSGTLVKFTIPSLTNAVSAVPQVLAVKQYEEWGFSGDLGASPGMSESVSGEMAPLVDYAFGELLSF